MKFTGFNASLLVSLLALVWSPLPAPVTPLPQAFQPPPVLASRAFLVAWFAPATNQLEILAEKNADQGLPLASLSKLFTAARAASEPARTVTVTPAALVATPAASTLVAGERFETEALLHAMLIESNNQAAMALAQAAGEDFLPELNAWARHLGLKTARLVNPTGLDPESPGAPLNVASAEDLLRLAVWLLREQPAIWRISRLADYPFYSAAGEFHHQLKNTNELITGDAWLSDLVVGSKTGQTDLAKKNLVVVLRAPRLGGYLIGVVLGADDHFAAMRELITWTAKSYKF